MRTLAAVAIFTTMIAGAASAQLKVTQQPAQPGTKVQQPAVLQAQPAESLDSARRIERDEAIKLVKQKKAVWVDVRDKQSYDAGHIKGAVNIPLPELLVRLKDLPPGKMIITYCA